MAGPCKSLHADAAQVREEIAPLVVDQDERREILHVDFPDRFHPKFGEFDDLHFLDVLLGEDRGGPADAAEVKAAVGLAGVGHGL